MAARLPTGIKTLDRQLDGGIPPGSLVVVNAPPISQSELILQQVVQERNTLYVTIERQKADVQDNFESELLETNQLVIRHPNLDSPLDNTRDALRQVTNQANIIIDSSKLLELADDQARYINFLNELTTQLTNTNSIAFIHCIEGSNTPELRDTTLQMADIVLDLAVDTTGDRVENKLSVPKFRGGAALKDNIKLELRDEVRVDTSRDIA